MKPEQINLLLEKVEKYKVPLILGLAGLIFIGLGLLLPKLNSSKKADIVFKPNSDQIQAKVKVDVSGAVKTPGVYTLTKGDRVLDAVYAAGGFTAEADSEWVASEMNLAAKVNDGQKIFIVTKGQTSVLGSKTEARINVNSASESLLDTLPGIGKVTTEKIVAGRPYGSVEELLSKKIVGKSTYEKIKDKISVF